MSVPRGQISELRSTLPSPRAISEALIADLNRPSLDFTLMLMQWGQFVDHDITHTPLTKGEGKSKAGPLRGYYVTVLLATTCHLPPPKVYFQGTFSNNTHYDTPNKT